MKYVYEECSNCKYCKDYEHRNTHYLRCTHPNWFRCNNNELKEVKEDEQGFLHL